MPSALFLNPATTLILSSISLLLRLNSKSTEIILYILCQNKSDWQFYFPRKSATREQNLSSARISNVGGDSKASNWANGRRHLAKHFSCWTPATARHRRCDGAQHGRPSHLSQWHGFHFFSTALRHRLPGDHLDWERLIMPGWIATLCGSAGLETIYLQEGKSEGEIEIIFLEQSRKSDKWRPRWWGISLGLNRLWQTE